MQILLCWDGDHIGRQVGRAVLSDDVAEVRRVDQAINSGNEVWKAFALRSGGSVIEIGGDEGRIEIEASHVSEVPDIARQYKEAVGASVSVGLGMKLSESAKALAVAKLRGGDQVLLWNQDMQRELDAVAAHPQSESDKLSDEYLSKSREAPMVHTGHDTGKNQGAHAGFSGFRQAGAAAGAEPDAKAVNDMVAAAAKEAPPAAETSQPDFESQLHSAAQQQEQQDTNDQVQDDKGADELKQHIVQVLSQVKQQLPVLSQMKQAAPDAYQAVMNLVQGVILLGREVMSDQPQPPPSDEEPAHVKEALQKAQKAPSANRFGILAPDHPDVQKIKAPKVDFNLPNKDDYAGAHQGKVYAGYIPIKHLKPEMTEDRNPDMDAYDWGEYEPKGTFPPVQIDMTTGAPDVFDGNHRIAYWKRKGFTHAPALFMDKSEMSESPATEADIEKAGVGSSGATEEGRHHLKLPVGSIMEGKVKVQHAATGKTGWVEAKAGMIQSQDATGHPVSSRNPGGK